MGMHSQARTRTWKETRVLVPSALRDALSELPRQFAKAARLWLQLMEAL